MGGLPPIFLLAAMTLPLSPLAAAAADPQSGRAKAAACAVCHG